MSAGKYFDINIKSEYIDTLLTKCIDEYTALRRAAEEVTFDFLHRFWIYNSARVFYFLHRFWRQIFHSSLVIDIIFNLSLMVTRATRLQ